MMKKAVTACILICLLSGTDLAKRRATSDARSQNRSNEIEKEVMRVLDDYMAAWNRKDLAGWEQTFHFPHYRLASGKMNVLQSPGMQDAARVWGTGAGPDWHHSRWDRRRIIHTSADKVHVDTKFTRCRANGSVINSFESLYILTREDGRWGVKLRSSFAP